MPVRGNHGDAVTNAVDDRNVDSRFRGNDEMRGGLWVSAGGHRDPPLRLRSGTEPVPGLIGEHCACPGEPGGMSLRVRLMIVMWIPASAGMTK